jgi:hypothetical protein
MCRRFSSGFKGPPGKWQRAKVIHVCITRGHPGPSGTNQGLEAKEFFSGMEQQGLKALSSTYPSYQVLLYLDVLGCTWMSLDVLGAVSSSPIPNLELGSVVAQVSTPEPWKLWRS